MPISPTPWKSTIGSIGGPSIQSYDGKFIADVRAAFIRFDMTTRAGGWKLEDAGEEAACNARLIAAAPDLLRTLKALTEAYSSLHWEGKRIDPNLAADALDAIAKAEGNTNKSVHDIIDLIKTGAD